MRAGQRVGRLKFAQVEATVAHLRPDVGGQEAPPTPDLEAQARHDEGAIDHYQYTPKGAPHLPAPPAARTRALIQSQSAASHPKLLPSLAPPPLLQRQSAASITSHPKRTRWREL